MNTLTFLLMTAFGVTATLADPHFYMCTDYKWTGLCHNMPAPLKKCMPLSNSLDGAQIWSAGPDKGLVCKLYRFGGCPDHYLNSGEIKFPGEENLDALGHSVRWSSYKCKAEK